MVVELEENEFEEKVLRGKGLTVVDFYASWCSPCKMLAKVMDELSSELADVSFVKINVDKASELASSFGIESIPVILVYKDAVKMHQVVGFQDAASIKQLLK